MICVGIDGHVDESLREICDEFKVFGIARLGSMGKWLRKHNAQSTIMSGKIFKTRLFTRWFFLKNIPDFATARFAYKMLVRDKSDCKDDTILGSICNLFSISTVAKGTVYSISNPKSLKAVKSSTHLRSFPLICAAN